MPPGNLMQRFFKRLSRSLVQDVPESNALCAFDCQKDQCSHEEWATCERRLKKAADELMPSDEGRPLQ